MNVEIDIKHRGMYQGEHKAYIVWIKTSKRNMPVYTGTLEECQEFIRTLANVAREHES
jgi:hypothetical protein